MPTPATTPDSAFRSVSPEARRATGPISPGFISSALALMLLGAAPGHAAQAAEQGQRDPGVVVEWNRLGYQIAYAEDQFLTFKGQRALAMMNLAMHDALNSIEPHYERYARDGERMDADPVAAAAWAAHTVLHAEYPASLARLDSLLENSSAMDRNQRSRSSRAAGQAAARAILEERRDDAWDLAGAYEYATGPGRYQTTPDWNGFVLQPGFGQARPFAIGSIALFRPEPPPSLEGIEYARAYNEVRSQGAAGSAIRTPDQTGYAVWWMEFSEGSVNRLARRLVAERDMGLWAAARLFAHLHVALYDAYIVTWDSKYAYDHWRPYTAIRRAAEDGNPETTQDRGWVSLLPAPPFPEYVSAHAAGCAAAFTVMSSAFGEETPFTMTTITAPEGMPERSFTSFAQASSECADSRVQLGWHFRYSTDAGKALGERVARHVVQTRLRPLKESDAPGIGPRQKRKPEPL